MNPNIFKGLDIRGRYPEEINEDLMDRIGNAFAQFVSRDIVVACDARNESPALMNAFMNGALKAEKTVMNIGIVPQAVALNWGVTQQMEVAYITASHTPKGHAGVKLFHADGTIYNDNENTNVLDVVRSEKYFSRIRATPVREEAEDILNIYVRNITGRIKSEAKKKTKILLDCGNGVNGIVAKRVFTAAGFNADVIFENPDGNFPNRGPDPKTDPMTELKKKVAKYDFGIAYDADGDRFFVMTGSGKIIPTEHVVHVLLSGISGPGDVVTNIDCGRALESVANKFNRKVVRVPVGVFHMEGAVLSYKAALGIESSQHCFVPSIIGFSDAIAASMLFSKVIQESGRTLEEFVKDVPSYPAARKNYNCANEKKAEVMDRIEKTILDKYGKLDKTEGIRVELEKGFVLVRPSKTEDIIRLTAEADTEEELRRLESEFSAVVEKGLSL